MVQSLLEKMFKIAGVESQKELAKLLEIEEPTISTWKKRGEIPAKQLQKFAKLTGTSLDSLQTGIACKELVDEDHLLFDDPATAEIIQIIRSLDTLGRNKMLRHARDEKENHAYRLLAKQAVQEQGKAVEMFIESDRPAESSKVEPPAEPSQARNGTTASSEIVTKS